MADEILPHDISKSPSGSTMKSPDGFYDRSNQGSGNTSQQPLRLRGLRDTGDKLSGDQSIFTENTTVPRRNLGFIQVTSLMLNACLGGGFYFTTPGYVLALVRSKRVCLVLWAVGGLYSALGWVPRTTTKKASLINIQHGSISRIWNGSPIQRRTTNICK
jgi:hypothetical protein